MEYDAYEKLFMIYDRMVGAVHLPTVLAEVAKVLCDDLRADRATVFLVNRETQELESSAVIGNITQAIRVPICASSLAGYCATTGKSFVVEDAYGDLGGIDPGLRFDGRWDERNHFRTRDVLCAPALFKGEIVGVIQLINRKDRPFATADLDEVRPFARLIGYALHNARLYHELATLKQLDKEKAQFMRVMVHELKSPASGAKMLTDLLASHEVAEPVANLHRRIAGRLDKMVEMIQDILVLAKAKSGEAFGEIGCVDLADLVRTTAETYRAQADEKGLAFEVIVPESSGEKKAVPVRFDTRGLQMVVSNLVSNGVKYTAAGCVTVTLCVEEEWARLAVRDTGMGIPAKDLPKLFQEFFRASNARQSKIGGSGVGLAGVKSLVERFGGQLALESQENVGSTFTLRLPLCNDG